MTVVALSEVVAVMSGFPVLAGASMTVDAGEIVVVSGPNGAGKTSLLRVCAGLLPISRGSASVCGVDLVTERHRASSQVGLLGHSNGLYLDLTVRENLQFWASTVGASAAEVDAASARLGLDGRLATVVVRRLSAGQRRRTALARLIIRRAQLWLLDEPHASLDAASRDELDRVLTDGAAAGATIVVASHDLDRVAALATRSVIVDGGRIVDDSGRGAGR